MKINPWLLKNSKGKVFYGMHFYPGLAQYDHPDGESFRVFLNEDTIRKMDPTFAGCPIFVDHVDQVDNDLNKVRGEADGWVLESFFNAADGKHWVKFIVTSELGLSAISRGYRLSNAYEAKSFGNGGIWNGMSYDREVLDGEFEHLALVNDPRYDESVVMTPEEFKSYNEEKSANLRKIANSHAGKGEAKMKLNFFKRSKLENSADLENTMVELPKSKRELSIAQLVNDHDVFLNMQGYANGDHLVKVGEKDEMTVNDLVKKHMEAMNEISELKKAHEKEGEAIEAEEEDDMDNESDDSDDRGGDHSVGNPDEDDQEEDHGSLENSDEDDESSEKDEKEKMKNEILRKRREAKEKADRLKNANRKLFEDDEEETPVLRLSNDMVARGRERYGKKN